MDVAQITMPADEARAKYDEYRQALEGREPTDEDRGVMLGYAALAKGRGVLDLYDVFRHCPADAKGRPALAIARAHWRRTVARIEGNGAATFDQAWPGQHFHSRTAWHHRITLPRETLAAGVRPFTISAGQRFSSDRTLRAVVPMIPPNLRPAKALHRYVILWEADWEEVPVDPMLLRHLHGSLYAVLGGWDLTPLERAVLAGRLSER